MDFKEILLCHEQCTLNNDRMSFGDIRASDLLDTLQIGVVVHSCDTKICYANPKALELLRLSTNQVLERTGLDPNWGFLDRHGNQMPIADYPVNRVVRSKSALKGLQVGIFDSSKHVTWLNCHAYPEFDADGEVDRVVVNFIDITSQKEAIPFKEIVTLSSDAILVTESTTIDKPEPKIIFANQKLHHQNLALKEINEQKNKILGIVAHDL